MPDQHTSRPHTVAVALAALLIPLSILFGTVIEALFDGIEDQYLSLR